MKYRHKYLVRNSGRFRGGSTVLEMALVAPILFSLSFGLCDYGYFLYLKNTFQGAAQAGARAAIPFNATNSNITGSTGVVTNMLTAAGISSSNYTVTLSPSSVSGLSAGTQITVTISSTWGAIGTHILSPSFGGMATSKVIKGVSVAEKEAN
jgi:Flp pilus assembly protein TadG